MRVLKNRQTKRAFGLGLTLRRRRCVLGIEGLEDRALMATISVNAASVVRGVDTQLLGVNVAWYDSVLSTPQTQQMVERPA